MTTSLPPGSYCHAVQNMPPDGVHRVYHDTQYGFALPDDNELFCRLVLEINQAGLSWTTILNKQQNFRHAYAEFDIQRVRLFNDQDVQRLLSDAGIIRNRLKVAAAIHNAQVIHELQQTHGSFKAWLDARRSNSLEQWVKEFKRTFRFTGGEIVNEFLMSTDYLPGAHVPQCPIHTLIQTQRR